MFEDEDNIRIHAIEGAIRPIGVDGYVPTDTVNRLQGDFNEHGGHIAYFHPENTIGQHPDSIVMARVPKDPVQAEEVVKAALDTEGVTAVSSPYPYQPSSHYVPKY